MQIVVLAIHVGQHCAPFVHRPCGMLSHIQGSVQYKNILGARHGADKVSRVIFRVTRIIARINGVRACACKHKHD